MSPICRFAGSLALASSLFVLLCGLTVAKDLTAETWPANLPMTSIHAKGPRSLQDRIYDLVGPNPAHSMAELARLIQAHPNAPEPYLQRGHAYYIDGDYENAMKDFRKALAVDPKCAGAHFGISRVLRGLGRYNEGFQELQKVEQSDNKDDATSALWESAFIHREMKQMNIAIEQYNTVIKRGLVGKTRQAWALFQRGELYLRIGQLDKALPDINQAIKMEPNVVIFRTVRAQLYNVTNKPKDELADLTFGIESEKKENQQDAMGLSSVRGHLPEFYRRRSACYQKLGKPDLAQADLKAAKDSEHADMEVAPFRLQWDDPTHKK